MTLLSAQAVSKRYGPTQALDRVEVSLGAGEVLALTGPSGSGKSTLLYCLSGILTPDEGEVWFGGARLDDRGEAARAVLRRTEIGVLLQHGQLVPELTAAENVALPLMLNGAKRVAATRLAAQWLERFGVEAESAKRPGELSGGQQQRVALARAMVTRPRLLFADEPTGSLDSVAGESVLTAMMSVAREHNTAIMLTHRGHATHRRQRVADDSPLAVYDRTAQQHGLAARLDRPGRRVHAARAGSHRTECPAGRSSA